MTTTTEIVTLCGSVRFKAEHLEAHWALSSQGHVVLLPALPVGQEQASGGPSADLASLHRRKIDMSHRVHVVNPGDYIGASTAAKIEYAIASGKRVTYEYDHR